VIGWSGPGTLVVLVIVNAFALRSNALSCPR